MKNLLVSALLAFACAAAFAQAPAASPPQRLRGSIEFCDGSTLVVKERSGEVLSSIETGSFVRTAAVTGAQGNLRAQTRDGQPTALRAPVGRDGFAPPM